MADTRTVNVMIVTTIGGGVRIDDMDEDAPLMTFHGPRKMEWAERVLRLLVDEVP